MVADMVDPRADHPPTVHHHLPLKAAILLHRQAIDLIHLQEKVPRAALVALVAPASVDLEVVAQEAQDSADQVAPEALVVLASVDQVVLASVVVREARVVREVVALVVLASVVVLVAREARASVGPAWALVDLEVRVCVAAHRRNGWPNEPSVLIVTATAN
jgi:hypothetical protein